MIRKLPKASPVDLIDLLLDADEPTRKLLIFQALQTGTLKKSEAQEIIAQMIELEHRADSPPVKTKAEDQVA